LFHSQVTYFSLSKVANHLSKQIKPILNESEGLSKGYNVARLKKTLVFLGTQNARIALKIIDTT